MDGKAVSIRDVNDATFRDGLLGQGVAIQPASGRVVSPADGVVSLMFETGHAVVVITNDGVEMLIHVGLDTVKLNGEHFTARVKTGDSVSKGSLLLEFDIEGISSSGYDVITPVVITNADSFESVTPVVDGDVEELDEIMLIHK
jgi:glucose-specific phosphotransferase system IIA component